MTAPVPDGMRGLDPRSGAGMTAEEGAGAPTVAERFAAILARPPVAGEAAPTVLTTSPPCQIYSRRTWQGDHAGPSSPPLTGGEREHICHVLRLFVTLRVSAMGFDLAEAPKPVKAVHAGRGARLDVRDLWLCGAWVGVTPDELRRAARRACGAGGRAAG